MTDTYEARGPHLPDVLTRQSPWVYLFVGAALLHAVLGIWELSGRGLPIDVDAILQVRFRIDDALVSLLGAALFVRHPDARRTRPLLAFGLGLLMLSTLLSVARGPIEGLLNGLAPTDDVTAFATPSSIAYSVFSSLVEIAGIVYVAAGLSSTRERDPGRGQRLALILLATMGIVIVLLPYAVIRIDRQLTPADWPAFGLTIGIALLNALAWAYLIATALGGWLSSEQPRPAWASVSICGLIILAIQLLSTLTLIAANLRSEPLQSSGLFTLIGFATTFVWVLFLAAFAIGLPARPERTETSEATAASGG